MRKFKTIVIDPPWPGPGACPALGDNSNVDSMSVIPYTTMSGIQIAALRVPEVAATDAQLFLWATTRSVGDAFLLIQLWGFNYRGMFIWCKRPGLGRHMRHQAEFLLWGGRKGAKLVEPKKCPVQFQHWPKPKRHSEKPAEAYELIARLSPAPRIDIFARQERPGFKAWGNEAPQSAQVQISGGYSAGSSCLPKWQRAGPDQRAFCA